MKEEKTFKNTLHQTALKAPSSSGVYLWRDHKENVIYVGKAKNLKHRLSSYFSGRKDIKTNLLVSRAASIEYITTANEYEAFLLENNLIKKYSPRYNINLKDGKSYPVLKITNEDFPRIFKTRNLSQDGSRYFGPYPDVAALDTFIETLYGIYPIRHCKRFKKREYPCMYFHIGMCLAPCCKKIDKQSYNSFFGEIEKLLEKKEDSALLEKEMKEAAKNLDFEKAARIRDGLNALKILQSQNVVEDFLAEDRDYISFWREGELASIFVLKMRGGKLQGRDNFRSQSLAEDQEILCEFMSAYYIEEKDLPPAIYVPSQSEIEFVFRWMKENFCAKTKIILYSDAMENAARHKAALDMARQNAREDIIRRIRERGDEPALKELQNLLGLKTLPRRIEGFDIAHIAGKFPVASLVSFLNGNPDKKNYRYFRLKTTDGIIDDFASMKEAVSRRYTRLLNEGAALPDLVLIDGGLGQVNAVKEIFAALNLEIPIAGLAKREEEIFLPHKSVPLCLPKRSDALRLLQRVRDETHRFATMHRANLQKNENTKSVFLELPNVGKKREAILAKNFFTLENLSNASEKDIAQILKIKEGDAKKIAASAKKLFLESRKKTANEKNFAAKMEGGLSHADAKRLAEMAAGE